MMHDHSHLNAHMLEWCFILMAVQSVVKRFFQCIGYSFYQIDNKSAFTVGVVED